MNCSSCGAELKKSDVLETFCTDPYSFKMFVATSSNPKVKEEIHWFRDIKKRCVCSRCGKEQDVLMDTVKQDQLFK